jgi:hypothetical protein
MNTPRKHKQSACLNERDLFDRQESQNTERGDIAPCRVALTVALVLRTLVSCVAGESTKDGNELPQEE